MKAFGLTVCLLLAFLVAATNGKSHGKWTMIFSKPESNSTLFVDRNELKPKVSVSPHRPDIIEESELKEMFKKLRDSSTSENAYPQNEEKQLKNVAALTNAIKTMLKVLKHTHFLDREIKEMLEGSRTFGLLFHESAFKGLEKTPEMKAFEDVKQKLLAELNEDAFQFLDVPDDEESYIRADLVAQIKDLQSQIRQVIQSFSDTNLAQLEAKCQSSNPLKIAEIAEGKLDTLIFQFVDDKTPERDDFMELKNVYTVVFKRLFAFSSICNVFHNESVVSGVSKTVNDTQLFVFVQKIRSKFEQKYWSTKRIAEEIKTQIKIGGTNADIAFNIHDELNDEYKDFGFTYHVGVSDEDNGFRLIYCISDCQYLNNYKNKTVFVLRKDIKQNRHKKYRTCEFLTSLQNDQNSEKWCKNHKKTYGDLRDLADEIVEKCKLSAFLIGVGRVDYQSEFDKKAETFFDHHFNFPCYGNVHIAAVNN
uniref:Uncharacterized protein n=1 Tax=Panagrolaimus sp. ES5 TaxID=591445 RepID=A0AC34GUN4_9BILA